MVFFSKLYDYFLLKCKGKHEQGSNRTRVQQLSSLTEAKLRRKIVCCIYMLCTRIAVPASKT